MPEAHFPAEDVRATTAVDPFQGSRYNKTNDVKLAVVGSGLPARSPGRPRRRSAHEARPDRRVRNRDFGIVRIVHDGCDSLATSGLGGGAASQRARDLTSRYAAPRGVAAAARRVLQIGI